MKICDKVILCLVSTFLLSSALTVVAQQTSTLSTVEQDSLRQSENAHVSAVADESKTAPSQHEKAEQQLQEEERQRILGVVPSFNVVYPHDVVSLSAGQKMRLAFHSARDPETFAAAAAGAGYKELMHKDVGFPWGVRGFGERTGAAYLDAFDGGMIGNGILPALLHQEPRYLRMGQGNVFKRASYAIAAQFICRHDNSDRWEPNYSNVGGNIAAGMISNLYYPGGNSAISEAFSNGMTVTAEGGLASIFQEFWPDISRKFLHRDPTHGIDAINAGQ